MASVKQMISGLWVSDPLRISLPRGERELAYCTFQLTTVKGIIGPSAYGGEIDEMAVKGTPERTELRTLFWDVLF